MYFGSLFILLGVGLSVTSTHIPRRHRCVCTKELMPVCGSDGKGYPNKCELKCAQKDDPSLELKHLGYCNEGENQELPAALKDPCLVCTMDYRPLCGTDGKTYNNLCSLRCAKKSDGKLDIAYSGPCKESEQVSD